MGVGVGAMQCPIGSCHAVPAGQSGAVAVAPGSGAGVNAMQWPIAACHAVPAGQLGVALSVGGAVPFEDDVSAMQCPIGSCQKVPLGHAATSGSLV